MLATTGELVAVLTPATSSLASVVVVGPLIVATLPIPLGRDWVLACRGVSARELLLTVGSHRLDSITPL